MLKLTGSNGEAIFVNPHTVTHVYSQARLGTRINFNGGYPDAVVVTEDTEFVAGMIGTAMFWRDTGGNVPGGTCGLDPDLDQIDFSSLGEEG